LPKLIGQGRARRLLLTGETIGASEALAWGLVDMVGAASGARRGGRGTRPSDPGGPAPKRSACRKSLILDWEELPTAAAVQRGIDCFVRAFDTDEPARMAGAMLAELRAAADRRAD